MNKKYYTIERRFRESTTKLIRYIEAGDLYNVNRYTDKILKLEEKLDTNLVYKNILFYKPALSITAYRTLHKINPFETLALVQECVAYLNEHDKSNIYIGIALSRLYRTRMSRSQFDSVICFKNLFNWHAYDVSVVNPVCVSIKDKDYYGYTSEYLIELSSLPKGLKFVGYVDVTNNVYGHIDPHKIMLDKVCVSFNKRGYIEPKPVTNELCVSLFVHENCTIESDNNIQIFGDSIKIDDIVDIEYKELPNELKTYYNPKYSPIEMVLDDKSVVRGLIADYNIRPEKLELFKDDSYIYKVIADVAGIQPIRLEEYNPILDKEYNIDYTDPVNGTVFISNSEVNVPIKVIYATSGDDEIFDEITKI